MEARRTDDRRIAQPPPSLQNPTTLVRTTTTTANRIPIASVSWKPPLIFHSKILCLSLLYLLTTVSLAIYASFSSSTSSPCVFRIQPPTARFLPPPPPPLFTYPSGYGERKHALPASVSAGACNSPLLFPEYSVAYDEIRALCANSSSSSSSSVLKYMAPKAGGDGGNSVSTFAGNFSTQKRKSFFDHRQENHDVEVPCGFLTEFPLHPSDRIAMEACRGVVVASAIFGDYDKIRQPRGVGERTLATVCFFMFIDEPTLKGLHSHGIFLNNETRTMGVWRIVVVAAGPLPYGGEGAMNGVILKHLIHRLFPNAKYSIWVDAKLQLVVDPLLLLHSLLVSKDADMAVSKHPFNVHTMEEAVATARWRKWRDVEALRLQMETYCANGLQPWSNGKLPYTTVADVPDTALIARRHGLRSDLFSCLLFNELEAFNPRDQLAFAYVRDLMSPKIKIHMFEVETFQQISVEYRHNLMKPAGGAGRTTTTAPTGWRRASSRDINGSSCERYLSKMWGETED